MAAIQPIDRPLIEQRSNGSNRYSQESAVERAYDVSIDRPTHRLGPHKRHCSAHVLRVSRKALETQARPKSITHGLGLHAHAYSDDAKVRTSMNRPPRRRALLSAVAPTLQWRRQAVPLQASGHGDVNFSIAKSQTATTIEPLPTRTSPTVA